jgi:hypothetical protein
MLPSVVVGGALRHAGQHPQDPNAAIQRSDLGLLIDTQPYSSLDRFR